MLLCNFFSSINRACRPITQHSVADPSVLRLAGLRSYIIITSKKIFILKYFRCRDGKRTETRIGMEGICITHSCIPLYTVYMQHIMAHSGGMQEWVIQIPSIPILVSVLFPSKYFRIKFLLLVCLCACARNHTHIRL